MILSRTPLRVSFIGGGTDFPQWYNENPGAVLATAIDKYCYISCRYLPPFFEHKYRIIWSQIELVQSIEEIRHPSVRESLKFMKIRDGVEVQYAGDLPARTGMGTSSAFTVGLLNALYALKGESPDKMQLACEAIHIEQDLIKESVGSQDQTTACLPGKTKIIVQGTQRLSVKDIDKISAGDKVLTYNEITSQKEWEIVTKTYKRKTKGVYQLFFENGNRLGITAEHPIFVVGKGWVEAKDIIVGDSVIQKRYPALAFRLWDFKMVGEKRAPITRAQWADPIQRKRKSEAISKAHSLTPELHIRLGKLGGRALWDKYNSNPQLKQKVCEERSNRARIRFSNLEERRKISQAGKIAQRKYWDSITDEERNRRAVTSMNNLSQISKIGNGTRMSSLERKLSYILRNLCPKEFKFNRKGQILKIGAKAPDFVNINGKKKLIEVFGRYWHDKHDEEKRVRKFREYGWDTLILWEEEFENTENIKKKVLNYLYNPGVDIVKIEKIEYVKNPQIVYNIETEKNHNYFAYGILVHNCFGGFNRIDFTGNDIKVTPIKSKRILELQDYLMLLFTGFSRTASDIEKEKIERISQNTSTLRRMYEMVAEGQKILSGNSDIKDFGRLLAEAWHLKRSLSARTSTGYIDYLYDKATKAGAIGGKLLGAGGGGFLLLFVEPEAQKRVRENLKVLDVPFRFESEGSKIVHYD